MSLFIGFETSKKEARQLPRKIIKARRKERVKYERLPTYSEHVFFFHSSELVTDVELSAGDGHASTPPAIIHRRELFVGNEYNGYVRIKEPIQTPKTFKYLYMQVIKDENKSLELIAIFEDTFAIVNQKYNNV